MMLKQLASSIFSIVNKKSNCFNQGKCLTKYNLCQCYDNWTDSDCGLFAPEIQIPYKAKVLNVRNLSYYRYKSSLVEGLE